MIQQLRGDFFGGITAGVIALPLALAFGVSSGAGAIAGVYGAIVVGFLAALFGGTKTQISGPTGPMTVVAASTIALFPHNFQMVVLIFMLAGIFQITLGVMRVGKFVQYIPYPVISGFMSGIGIIIILLQINPLFGSTFTGTTLAIIANLHLPFTTIHLPSLLLGIGTLLILFFTPKPITRIIPPTLIALFGMTTIAKLGAFDIETIGTIPSGLPQIHLPDFEFEKLNVIVPYAFTLAVLGSIDSLLTSLVADSLTKQKHDSNRELIGQGLGNMFSGLIGGLPGAGATMRTVVNIKSGGTTRLSGVIHSLFLLGAIMGAGEHVGNIPLPVLAGILIKVGVDILDYRLLTKIHKAPKYDLYVMISVLILTVFIDLIVAVGVGIVLSSLLLIHRITRKIEVKIKDMETASDYYAVDAHQSIRIITIEGPFFFGSISEIINRTLPHFDTQVLIFDCSKVPFMDVSAIFTLEEMLLDLRKKEIEVLIITHSKEMYDRLVKMDIPKIIGEKHLFVDAGKAFAKARLLVT